MLSLSQRGGTSSIGRFSKTVLFSYILGCSTLTPTRIVFFLFVCFFKFLTGISFTKLQFLQDWILWGKPVVERASFILAYVKKTINLKLINLKLAFCIAFWYLSLDFISYWKSFLLGTLVILIGFFWPGNSFCFYFVLLCILLHLSITLWHGETEHALDFLDALTFFSNNILQSLFTYLNHIHF